jgi:circadian clock protein KaiC
MIDKIRGGNHSEDIREFEITSEGLRVGDRLTGYRGLITGIPTSLNLVPPDGQGVAGPRDQ